MTEGQYVLAADIAAGVLVSLLLLAFYDWGSCKDDDQDEDGKKEKGDKK